MAKMSFNSDLIYLNCLYPGYLIVGCRSCPAAEMDYLKIFQKLRQCTGQPCSRYGTQTSANDHDHSSFIGSKAAHVKSASRLPQPAPHEWGEPVRTALSAGIIFFHSLREIAAYLFCHGNAQLIGQSGVISDSWMIQGICKEAAARDDRRLRSPPWEKTTSGW